MLLWARVEAAPCCETGPPYVRLHAEGAGRVGDALRVIAAGVGDDAATALVVGERADLVVGAAQLEGADRLQAFRLEKELARRIVMRAGNQRSAGGNSAQSLLGRLDVRKSNDGAPRMKHVGRRSEFVGWPQFLNSTYYLPPATYSLQDPRL